MKATETSFVKFLQGTKQFTIPIYQRTYSWTEKQCEQLWNDIIQVTTNKNIPAHFVGSIVYIEKGLYQVSDVPQLLVIDGQQRLTTLSLLLAALSRTLNTKEDNEEITSKKINNYFLFNSEESKEKYHKLILTQSDKYTLIALLDGREPPEKYSKNIVTNFEYFQTKIAESGIGLNLLWQGIRKLIIVDISLNSEYDNPQLIFESLNSTGLELSQSDLIRNYVLMGLEKSEQEFIYDRYWYPIEESFGHSEGADLFDKFMRDYLTIKIGYIPNIRNVYSSFKEYFIQSDEPVEKIISEMYNFSKIFTKLIFEKEDDPKLNQIIQDINTLKVDVAYPFLLEIYHDYVNGEITKDDVLEIFSMVESYVFRRSICGIPTNSLNKTFANLSNEIIKEKYLESVKAMFILKEGYRRFPSDEEFRNQFIVKDIYNTTRIRRHLFDKLENYNRKERSDIEEYTLEHIMPQYLSSEWRGELGPNWKNIHEKYLHTVGNLTLTGYNPELGNRPFKEKCTMEGGFMQSPIVLNRGLGRLECWNESEIEKRANVLCEKAIKIWKCPELSQEILDKYKVEENDFDDNDDESTPQWSDRFKRASNEIQQNVTLLISAICEKFGCVAEPKSRCIFFYTKKPIQRKNRFAVIDCGKNTATIMFRINPDTFKEDDKIRKIAGWFFPRGTERRIRLPEDVSFILKQIDHSYQITLNNN